MYFTYGMARRLCEIAEPLGWFKTPPEVKKDLMPSKLKRFVGREQCMRISWGWDVSELKRRWSLWELTVYIPLADPLDFCVVIPCHTVNKRYTSKVKVDIYQALWTAMTDLLAEYGVVARLVADSIAPDYIRPRYQWDESHAYRLAGGHYEYETSQDRTKELQ